MAICRTEWCDWQNHQLMKGLNMVALVALTGGMLAAGWSVYKYWNAQVTASVGAAFGGQPTVDQENDAQALQLPSESSAKPADDPIPRTQEEREVLQHGVRTSSISLGLASAGLFFSPIQYASIPVLIYMGAPSARHAYDMLHEQGRPSRVLAETAVLAICLGGGWYLAGSLGFWLYYLGRLNRCNRNAARFSRAIQAAPQSARLRQDDQETVVPAHTLQKGAQVLVGTSEIVPVDGMIVEGAAWVQPGGSHNIAECRLLRVGDRVMASDLVIAGQLSLRVQRVS
ncbi:MAG: hypothetical protein R2911_37940 [Caldilineaceae bacterium]